MKKSNLSAISTSSKPLTPAPIKPGSNSSLSISSPLSQVNLSKLFIDVNAGADMIYAPPSSFGNARVLGATIPSHIERHYVFDIETCGRRPDLIHMAVLMPIDDTKNPLYFHAESSLETWDEIESHFYLLLQGNAKRTKIWAHYGASFDYVGLADHLGVAYGHAIKNTIAKANVKSLKKTVKINAETIDVIWSVKVWGNRQRLVLKIDGKGMQNRIDFDDSSYHMPGKLSNLGAKGITPLQYTDPDNWLSEHYQIDLSHKDAMSVWYAHVDQIAVDYCIQDCKVLADALNLWRSFWMKNFGLDALDYMTSSKLALHGCIRFAALPEKTSKGLIWHFIKQPESKFNRQKMGASAWKRFTGEPTLVGGKVAKEGQKSKEGKGPIEKLSPLARKSEYAICPAGWSAPGLVENFDLVATGGRAEVFANATNDGLRPFVIDINSTYPDVNVNCRFVDPRFLVESSVEVVGKHDVEEMLKVKSGMFKIELDQIKDSILNKFPVNWIRLSSECGVEGKRLAFVDWEGILMTWMTSEELSYVLEFLPADHYIKIVKSISGQKIPSHNSPNSKFSASLFAERRAHEKKAKELELSDPDASTKHKMFAMFAKLANNAGSFGIFSETHCEMEQIIYDQAGDLDEQKVAAMVVVKKLIALDSLWSAISDPEKIKEWTILLDETESLLSDPSIYIKTAINFAHQWGLDYWRPATTFVVNSNRGSTHSVTEVPTERYLAPHAIKCWAAQITAHARVKLHRALVAAHNAGYQVCYADTDSLHLGVPKDLDDEAVVKTLVKAGVKIGEELGDWKVEKIGGSKGLGEGAAVKGYYIAPKVYAYVNAKNEVIHTVCKGIPADFAVMRAAMSSISAHPSKIGCKLGLKVSHAESRDALANITKISKRNFTFENDVFDSMPIVIKSPAGREKLDWSQYLNALAVQVISGKATGVSVALSEYLKCTFNGKSIKELRLIIDAVKNSIDLAHEDSEIVVDSNFIAMTVNRKFRSLGIDGKLSKELQMMSDA